MVLLEWRTNWMACWRNSGGYGGLVFLIVDSLLEATSPNDEVSTKPGQLQRNVLIRLGMVTGLVEQEVRPTYLTSSKLFYTHRDATYHSFVEVGKQIEEEETIGELRDLFGDTLQVLKTRETWPVLFLVTSPAGKKGDPLIGIGVV